MTEVIARDGDVLVVSYPEVKIPVVQYGSVTVGGLIFTRKLNDGDNVSDEFDTIYRFLKTKAETLAADKVKTWAAEMSPKTEPRPAASPPTNPNTPPKPALMRPVRGAQ
jgi:hypothetical protein